MEEARGDSERGLIHLIASDGLQTHCDGLSQAEILALIPGGQWHEGVFGERLSGWDQVQQVLSTTLQEIHYGPSGMLTVGDITNDAAGAPLTESQVLYLSEQPELAPRRSLINRVVLTLEIRAVELCQRHHGWGWVWPVGTGQFCTWLEDPFRLPSQAAVEAAALKTGWAPLAGVTTLTLPDAGLYGCPGGDVNWDPGQFGQEVMILSAQWTGFRRWARTVTRRYELTVESAAGIARYGAVPAERAYSHEYPFDAAGWEANVSPFTPTFGTDAPGDLREIQVDTADEQILIETALAVARRELWDAHAANRFSYAALCDTGIDIALARAIDTPGARSPATSTPTRIVLWHARARPTT
jgi:hypothetical protein